MVLTVMKTINIINPFYRIHGLALKNFLATISFFGLTLSVVDISNRSKLHNSSCTSLYGFWEEFERFNVVGNYVIYEIFESYSFADSIYLSLITFEFFLPCLIVLISMILQMVYIKRAFSQSSDPRQNTANRVNTTILLISLLYLLSSSVYSCFVFKRVYSEIEPGGMIFISFELEMLARFTLPLLNAALFPTILILRKPDLRARYKGYISAVLRLPVFLFYWINVEQEL
jgi:hypothetical protein